MAEYCDLIFADDVLTAITHPELEVVEELAILESEGVPRDLAVLGLGSEITESKNLIIMADETAGGAFRREPKAHRKSVLQEEKRDDIMAQMNEQKDKPGTQECGVVDQARCRLPYPEVDEMKVLGVSLDRRLGYNKHIDNILDKAKIRLAEMSGLTGSNEQ